MTNGNKVNKLNIVLIGMPGCGKSSIGAELARLCGCSLFDTDEMVVEMAGISIPEIFALHGEEAFRELERQAVALAAQSRGSVIATGGGTVLKEGNGHLLAQNGRFYFIERGLGKLPTAGRPLSVDLAALYDRRSPIYRHWAHAIIDNNDTIIQAAQRVLRAHEKLLNKNINGG